MDLNVDGHVDLLSGSYSRNSQPMAGLFQVLWGQADGSFKKAAVLNGSDDKPLIIPASPDHIIENICTRPTAADFNGDGHLDLVVGNFAGGFYLFTGEGKGKFKPQPAAILVDDKPLKINGVHSDPFLVDFDGDGDLDLLSGSSNGGVQWSENSAGKGKPVQLGALQTLIKPGPEMDYNQPLSESDLKGPASASRVWADDINGDGKLDLLVGDNVTLTMPAKGLTRDEFARKQADWQKEVNQLTSKIQDADSPDATQAIERLRELYTERSKFVKMDSTGFVWLYLQK